MRKSRRNTGGSVTPGAGPLPHRLGHAARTDTLPGRQLDHLLLAHRAMHRTARGIPLRRRHLSRLAPPAPGVTGKRRRERRAGSRSRAENNGGRSRPGTPRPLEKLAASVSLSGSARRVLGTCPSPSVAAYPLRRYDPLYSASPLPSPHRLRRPDRSGGRPGTARLLRLHPSRYNHLKLLGKSIAAMSFLLLSSMPCLLYTSPSPRDRTRSRMPSSA